MPDFLSSLRLKNLFQVPESGIQNSSMQDQNSSPVLMNGFDPGSMNSPESTDPMIQRMHALYQPESMNIDKLNTLLNQYPIRDQNKPSILRRIASGVVGLGQGPKAQEQFLDTPFNEKLADWQNQVKPIEAAANIERAGNVNNRQMAMQTIGDQIRNEQNIRMFGLGQQKVDETVKNDKAKNDAATKRIAINELKTQGAHFIHDPNSAKIFAFKPTGEMINSFDTGGLDKKEILDLTGQQKLNQIAAIGANQQDNGRGLETASIPDPNDPTKQIGVVVNKNTRQAQPIQIDGQNTPINKPGSSQVGKLDAQTATIMNGAKMLLPSIPTLRQQAMELNKRGLFGPMMSRVRDYGAKIGTIGDPNQVQSSFEDFDNAIKNDPRINSSGDRLVGDFLANLGLMASGAGRVHGGARGGGSIQMIQYMKSLLSSSSTLEMFQGRLDALERKMKEYAAGPTPVGKPKDKLDSALDKLFGVANAK